MTARWHYVAALTISLLLHLSAFALWRTPRQSLPRVVPPLLIRLQGQLSPALLPDVSTVNPRPATLPPLPAPERQGEASEQAPLAVPALRQADSDRQELQPLASVKEPDSAMETAQGRPRGVSERSKASADEPVGLESHKPDEERTAGSSMESSLQPVGQDRVMPDPQVRPSQDIPAAAQALADARSARPSPSTAASRARVEAIRSRYEQVLFAWLSKNKRYPMIARRRRLEGDPKLRIVISRSGNVVHCEFLRRSGHAVLDEATLRMVAAADPFPPIPDDYPGDRFEFIAPLSFRAR